MKLNLLGGSEKRFLGALTAISSELRGIRVALELLALKERATPPPDLPDDADFLAQSDEEFAGFEKAARGGVPEVEEEVEEEEPLGRHPPGSFLPRFPTQ